MSSTLEYSTYDEAERCLDDNEALERYRTEKERNPGALVVLDELHCGEHWKVNVYSTKTEKEKYLRERVRRIFDSLSGKIERLQSAEK